VSEPTNKLQYNVNGYAGIDKWLDLFFTGRMMAKRAAKLLMKPGNPFHGYTPGTEAQMILNMPDGAYVITDLKGNVKPWNGPVRGVGA
jgi:hypothetical protein